MNLVIRGVPFQRAVAARTKPVPRIRKLNWLLKGVS